MIHIGVVTSGRDVLWIGAAATPAALAGAVTEFLLPRVRYQLWQEDAGRFLALVEEGQPLQAVELYFQKVGCRWDAERLEVVTREVSAPTPMRRSRPTKPGVARGRPLL